MMPAVVITMDGSEIQFVDRTLHEADFTYKGRQYHIKGWNTKNPPNGLFVLEATCDGKRVREAASHPAFPLNRILDRNKVQD